MTDVLALAPLRSKLEDRHYSVTTKIEWRRGEGPDHHLIITYGFNGKGRIKEAFCAAFRRDSDMVALANDACILLSRLLQFGDKLENIVPSLGEDRGEGQNAGPPSSLIGAIARKAIEIERGE